MKTKNISKNEQRREFDKLKSDFIFKKLISIIKTKKSLEIMKYNKKLQKRLNMNINNYIKYSELYTSIEIELKLADKKYGKFINIPDKEKVYYHIYFDDSNEEIK